MGQKQSKGELLFEQVRDLNSRGIRALHREGPDLECKDRKGRTPLIMACMKDEFCNVAKTLIELGANVNAYCPGRHAGTPLHHAAKSGYVPTVMLLLSHSANPIVLNDDGQTPLEVARDNGCGYVAGAIERHICLFSGYMRQTYGPAKLRSDKLWVVVVPTGSRNPSEPSKLEVVVYDRKGRYDDEPRTVMPLWKAKLEMVTVDEPIRNHTDISVIITVDDSTSEFLQYLFISSFWWIVPSRWRQRLNHRHQLFPPTHLRLSPSTEGDEQQLKWFFDACKGIPQPTHPPNSLQTPPSAPPLMSETPNNNHLSIGEASSLASPPPPPPPSSGKASTSGLNSHKGVIVHEPSPSAPPLTDDDVEILEEGPVHYPTIDSTHVDVPSSSPLPASSEGEKKEDGSAGQCSICLDAPSDAVCVPCGHVAGCLSCLTEIKSENWRCPVCRAKIDRIVKLYRV